MDTISQDAPQGNDSTPKTTFIYVLRDPSKMEEIRYVGKSNNPQQRLKQHIQDKSDTYRGHWLTSLRKQGLIPQMDIIEEVPFEIWQERELFWIEHYTQLGHPLTNTYFGSEGTGIIPQETRAKISAAHKGKKVSPESVTKRIASQKGRKNTPETIKKMRKARLGKVPPPRSKELQQQINESLRGQKRSAETKAKISQSRLGKERAPFSEEWSRHLSEARRGRALSAETREKIAASKRGKRHSDEARAKMSAAKSDKKQSPEHIAKRVDAIKKAKTIKQNPPDSPTLWD